MKRLLLLLALALPAFSQTTVTDTLYDATGGLANGTITLTPNSVFTAIGGHIVYPVQITVNVVRGLFSVVLYANVGATPSGTYYQARYSIDNSNLSTEIWVVPASPNPSHLPDVRSITVPAQPGFTASGNSSTLITGTSPFTQSTCVTFDASNNLIVNPACSFGVGLFQVSGRLQASGATSTAPMKVGSSPPATCTVGDKFFNTSATAGRNDYNCTATDTWTQETGGGGGGTPGGSNNDIQVNVSSAFGGGRGTLDSSGNMALTGTLSTSVGSGAAGSVDLIAGTAPGLTANSVGFGAPTTVTTPLRLLFPNSAPTANQVMVFPAPTSNVAQWNWVTFNSSSLTDGTNLVRNNTSNAWITGTQDMTAVTHSLPFQTGTTLPATCAVGEAFFKSNATAGQNIYECAALNTWTQQLNSGAGGASTALDNLASVNINTALLAQTGVDAGSTAKPFRDLYLFGAGSYGTTSLKLTGTPTAARVWTLPDRTDTVAGLGANTFTGRQDASGAASTAPAKTGTSLPGTCIVGDLYFKSDATAGQMVYECSASNTWTQETGGGGGTSSVFDGSTASTIAASATPTFDLANTSSKSPVRFEVAPISLNVTGPTFLNKRAGAKFSIVWTQIAAAATVVYGGAAANTCTINASNGISTTQFFEIAADGTTVNGVGCVDNSGSVPAQRVASGSTVLGTSAISGNSCATVVTTSATGAAAGDVPTWAANTSIKAVTGYSPASTGLTIRAYITVGSINFDVCNPTSGSITPGAVTLDWKVIR